ncbi:30S ribosomal protein S6 [Salipaludibacillus agaradhaerens]|jgi:small subunit ribosomal protein S6|uniref:Small ribosomal subunit protein bS6 n=1 Tax=Salipaludibacillus agaradhaerens TaxID=76935 RepID=A0A9Q4B4X1_SALAG|nr:30S ribosomal protein S6 [Salipaludibacillus agaradhaerens]UJW59566.1 30S ribosomal protein S6 [Bacillus sp. A116_S68]MCR6098498.1 30S ribosomal protein S6 [Salipaludibacillus agaradhaerens]MCR6108538.1 30S ribosomal protein S6 [Salipaludibacillus agaradhaerens]MCR6115872.1 30S ribosomal protein S6 [Salipaludibacillus agaradhaerens]MCR6120559.1 30S ribosomal protein S6 [Salipaludibacillus agaradhaerens]
MRNYEIMYIVRPNLEEAAIKETIERFNKILTDNGAEVTETEEMGKKRLAYEIEDFTEGFYVLLKLKAGKQALDEFNRLSSINDNILRTLTVREDE